MDEKIQYLQPILGTDKSNPSFTVFQHSDGNLHIYYGNDLLEVVPGDQDSPTYKLLVARLYNAGVNRKALKQAFGYDRKTMQRWGEALRSDDPELLIKALSGRGGPRKLNLEIRSYVRTRFADVYRETPKTYSRRLRAEIKEVFSVSLSGETLRPLFKELKSILKRNPATDGSATDPAPKASNGSDEDGSAPSGTEQERAPHDETPAASRTQSIGTANVEDEACALSGMRQEAPQEPSHEPKAQAIHVPSEAPSDSEESSHPLPPSQACSAGEADVGLAAQGPPTSRSEEADRNPEPNPTSGSGVDACVKEAQGPIERADGEASLDVRGDVGASTCESDASALSPQLPSNSRDVEITPVSLPNGYRRGSPSPGSLRGPLHHLGVLVFFGVFLKIEDRFTASAGTKGW